VLHCAIAPDILRCTIIKQPNFEWSDNRSSAAFFVVLLLQTHTFFSTQHLAAGTASYMAPECFTGGHVGEKADVYSLGCMLWECVTGEPPWRGLNVVQVAYQVRMCAWRGLGGKGSCAFGNEPERQLHSLCLQE
jgi:serine/threonine protein kinase